MCEGAITHYSILGPLRSSAPASPNVLLSRSAAVTTPTVEPAGKFSQMLKLVLFSKIGSLSLMSITWTWIISKSCIFCAVNSNC